jgi:hypothetical protein
MRSFGRRLTRGKAQRMPCARGQVAGRMTMQRCWRGQRHWRLATLCAGQWMASSRWLWTRYGFSLDRTSMVPAHHMHCKPLARCVMMARIGTRDLACCTPRLLETSPAVPLKVTCCCDSRGLPHLQKELRAAKASFDSWLSRRKARDFVKLE